MFSWEIRAGFIPYVVTPWEFKSFNVLEIEVYEYVDILRQIAVTSRFLHELWIYMLSIMHYDEF